MKVHARCKHQIWRSAIIVMLTVVLLFFVFARVGLTAGKDGTISGCPSTTVRKEASTSGEFVTTKNGSKVVLPSGYEVSVLKETYSEDKLWYYISFVYNGNEKYEGYVLGKYVAISSGGVVMDDKDFEAYLTKQGFPESYKTYLRVIHEEHPSWVFEAQHTNLDWEASVAAESELGKNLIPNSSPVSWKSMETGAYNPVTNTWVVFDGDTWVAASKEIIAYYMDPRNFLNDINIFQFEVLSYNSGYQTADGISAILDGSFMEGSYVDTDGWAATYAEAFIYAAEQSGVSPYHLASRALQELGYDGSGSSSGAVEGYEGIFNFYNIGATSSSNPVLNGLNFASQINADYFLPWNTKWKAIAGGAIYLGKRYINVGQDTLYLQKFNVQGTNLYNHQYMTNVQAPSAEAGRLAEAYSTSLDRAIVFKIPVYLNMPGENVPLPTETGTQIISTALSFLEVEGYELSPSFSGDVLEYSVSMTEYTGLVSVNASALSQNASVAGAGNTSLKEGDNVVRITVSAENGASTTYTINISVPYANYTINGNGYAVSADSYVLQKINDGSGNVTTYIYGFEQGQSVDNILSTITPINCSIKILNHDKTVNNGIVATNNILQILTTDASTVLEEIPIVIFGDTTGDGAIDGRDMLYMYRHILGIAPLEGVYAEAADVRWDTMSEDSQGAKTSDITGVDMLYVQRHLLGISYISQK